MSASRNLLTTEPRLKLMVEISLIVRFWRSLMDDHLRPLSITHTHSTILWWIAEEGKPLSQTDLARKIGIGTSTLVRQLDVLESRGLVERKLISDRRVRLIGLSADGEAVVQRNREIAEQLTREMLEGIGIEAIEQCVDLMFELRTRFQADKSAGKRITHAGPESST